YASSSVISSASMTLLVFLLHPCPPPSSTPFPYTTLFRSPDDPRPGRTAHRWPVGRCRRWRLLGALRRATGVDPPARDDGGPSPRSEEHTSELQSRFDLVCRLLLEKKNKTK